MASMCLFSASSAATPVHTHIYIKLCVHLYCVQHICTVCTYICMYICICMHACMYVCMAVVSYIHAKGSGWY